MAARSLCLVLFSACLVPRAAVATSNLRLHRSSINNNPLSTPNLVGYEPEKILCYRKDKLQPWCKTWLSCIKGKAEPAGTKAAVKTGWAPATCQSMCGTWPVLLQGLKTNDTKKVNTTAATVAKLLHLSATSTHNDCLTSCANFQDSLSGCVATILFEPGKLTNMGLGQQQTSADVLCTKTDTPCKPTLAVEHQKCLGHKTKEKLHKATIKDSVATRCAAIASDFIDCSDARCPQMDPGYHSEYAHFTGGCMDQLNAYHAATDPAAGTAAMPDAEASGCQVQSR